MKAPYDYLKEYKTYCPLLWNSAFIDQKGSVYICCHRKPGIIGNIYKRDLFNIWTKSIRLKVFRQLSLNKCLKCFFRCNILSRREKEGVSRYPVSMKYPSRLRIQCGEACNLKCIMCRQDHHSKVAIDVDILKKNIDWSQIEEIEFQGGEVLAMKNAKELYLWLTKQMNKKTMLITNGMLINDEWAQNLVKGSRWVQISVNAATKRTHEFVNEGSNYEKVINNIKKLIYLKHYYGADCIIKYKYTIVPENIYEIADAIAFADSLGCDEIIYGYDPSASCFLRKNKELREQLKNRISQLINSDLKIKVKRDRLEQLGLVESVTKDIIEK